jgi:hypothetical protein
VPLAADVWYGLTRPAKLLLVEIGPSGLYIQWWRHVQACTGLTGKYPTIVAVNSATLPIAERDWWLYTRRSYVGQYVPERHLIIIPQTELFEYGTVAHEMVHALGVNGHDEAPGNVWDRCGVR